MNSGQPPLRPPTLGEPAWLPDPTRRHELRWFDGTTFTDHVADGTIRSTDPGGPTAPVSTAPIAPETSATKGSRTALVMAGIGIGAVLGGGAYLLFGGDDGGGFGTFEGAVGEDPGEHAISLSGGSVAVVQVDPSSNLDAVVGFRLDRDDADRIADLYAGTPFAVEATRTDGEVFRLDVGYEGRDEVTFLAAPFGLDATVVVSGFDGSEGDYEIDIEEIALEGIDERADGEDILDALATTDELPSDLRNDIASRLDE